MKRVLNSMLGVFSLSPTITRLANFFFDSSFNAMKSLLCYISILFDNLAGQLTRSPPALVEHRLSLQLAHVLLSQGPTPDQVPGQNQHVLDRLIIRVNDVR